MKKILFLSLVIIIAVIIANYIPWQEYPTHAYNPLLIISIWKELFPEIPYEIFLSSVGSILFLIFTFRLTIAVSFKSEESLGVYRKSLILRLLTINKDKSKYGYAYFIKNLRSLKRHIKKFELNFKQGIVLGKLAGKFIRSNLPYSTLILAPPGTGKTAGIIIPNLLLCDNSMIIHDIKGELYDMTSDFRRSKFNHQILLFDPASDNSLKFNIFAKSILPENKDNLRSYVSNVANILFSGQKVKSNSESGDGYFENAAKSTFIFIAQWLIYKNGYTSIPQIRSKLLEDEDTAKVIEQMSGDKGMPSEIREDGRGVLVASVSENQWAGIIGQLKEALELFADNRIKSVTDSGCDFEASDLRKDKITIYIKIRDKDKKRLRPLISLIFDSISTQLISEMPKKSDNNITFILDEFIRLGRMDFISDLPAVSRGYKLNAVFVAQDYEQISKVYGQGAMSEFDSNCAYKIVLTQNSFKTADNISKLIGNKTTIRSSENRGNSSQTGIEVKIQGNRSSSQSISQEGIALVSAQDVLNLQKGKCLIIVQGHASNPIIADNPFWFEDKKLKKLLT